jgi:7-cyano-7-deazaguanine synthase
MGKTLSAVSAQQQKLFSILDCGSGVTKSLCGVLHQLLTVVTAAPPPSPHSSPRTDYLSFRKPLRYNVPVMTHSPARSTIGLLLSGGLDSAILLGDLLRKGRQVQPFYVRSHLCWEREELQAVEQFLAAMASRELAELVVLDVPVDDIYQGHWSLTRRAVPAAGTPDDAVYLPGRNVLLLVKATLWCRLHGIDQLALAVLASNPFGDATDAFFADFESVMERATGGRVCILRPLAGLTKRQVMDLGRHFPLELTFSCIAPVDGVHCGRCNKCAERSDAFRQSGVEDPTVYAKGERS